MNNVKITAKEREFLLKLLASVDTIKHVYSTDQDNVELYLDLTFKIASANCE